MKRAQDYHQSVRSVALANSTAIGYSILITATLALLADTTTAPDFADVFAATLSTLGVFAIIEFAATDRFRKRKANDSNEEIMIGTTFNFFAVGMSVLGVYGVTKVTDGLWK